MHKTVARVAWTVHVAFVVFTVFGGFLAWLVPWLIVPHLGSAAWGARMATLRSRCPLSTMENWGRRGAGQDELHTEGFIAHYVEGRLYPARWARRVEVLVGTLVVGSWIGLSLR